MKLLQVLLALTGRSVVLVQKRMIRLLPSQVKPHFDWVRYPLGPRGYAWDLSQTLGHYHRLHGKQGICLAFFVQIMHLIQWLLRLLRGDTDLVERGREYFTN